MKKIILFFLISLFLIQIVSATTIYEYLEGAKQNPEAYTIVASEKITQGEAQKLGILMRKVGIVRNELDFDVRESTNLIVLGNPTINSVTQRLVGNRTFGNNEGSMAIVGTNLIIAGSSSQVNSQLLEILNQYPQQVEELMKNEHVIGTTHLTVGSAVQNEQFSNNGFFSPLVFLFVFLILATALTTALVNVHVKKKKVHEDKKSLKEKQEKQDLDNYIKMCINRGYNLQQIRQVLIQNGWPQETINEELQKLANNQKPILPPLS